MPPHRYFLEFFGLRVEIPASEGIPIRRAEVLGRWNPPVGMRLVIEDL